MIKSWLPQLSCISHRRNWLACTHQCDIKRVENRPADPKAGLEPGLTIIK